MLNRITRDFGISCPRYTLPAIMQWHLNYEGPKLNADYADLSQDPLVLCPFTTASNGVDFPLEDRGHITPWLLYSSLNHLLVLRVLSIQWVS